MVSVDYFSTKNSLLNSRNLKIQDGFSFQRDMVPVPVPYQSAQISPPPPVPIQATVAPSPSSKISPAVLFIIVILAVIFFISGLLHLLVRFIIKKQPQNSSSISNQNQQTEISGSEALQRQLQQLFHLHDSGLDQAFIDALPVFLYKEIVGAKEPFDCAVCLCEFSDEEKLRLLPPCISFKLH
ncbi:E3 ubiquitin-protein ligase, ATL family [Carex littledalei]|uniref:E3 ubiquitin-protein ligase, ATL family n=1 Tax=Carex littledalei TaxID=544730 RepID=A0A833VNW6_9POAL|nr:E3 ubiquitin-protein ligase, ATL family [Carex littledalei]